MSIRGPVLMRLSMMVSVSFFVMAEVLSACMAIPSVPMGLVFILWRF